MVYKTHVMGYLRTMKNIVIGTLVVLSTMLVGCGASGFTSIARPHIEAYENPGSVCDRMPAHRTRRVHTPIVVDGVSYFCF